MNLFENETLHFEVTDKDRASLKVSDVYFIIKWKSSKEENGKSICVFDIHDKRNMFYLVGS